MKGEITDSLKPPLTKKPSEVGYWKLNEMPGSSECPRQKINSWISEVKQDVETIAIEQSQNGRGEYQVDKITYAKGVTLNAYLPIKWMAPNRYCRTFFVHWSGQVYYSIT